MRTCGWPGNTGSCSGLAPEQNDDRVNVHQLREAADVSGAVLGSVDWSYQQLSALDLSRWPMDVL